MRCGCPYCEAYMINSDTSTCVCPHCSYRCDACLGTATALSREQLLQLKNKQWFSTQLHSLATEENNNLK